MAIDTVQSKIVMELSNEIYKSEVVVVWGSTFFDGTEDIVTSLVDKELIVIDPVKTKIAKKANLHIALAPRSDFYLAILLARFVFLEELHDIDTLKDLGLDYEEFYDFVRTFRIKALLSLIDTSLDDIGDMLLYLENKKVLFVVGKGVQRYAIATQVVSAIESLAMILGQENYKVVVMHNTQVIQKSNEDFEFLDEYDDDVVDRKKLKRLKGHQSIHKESDDFWLVNLEVATQGFVSIHPAVGFKEEELVVITSEYGSINLRVRLNQEIRSDTIYIGALPQELVSLVGASLFENACYGEVKVSLSKVLI